MPDTVSTRRNIKHAKTTDSEIITISLYGEIAGIDSENAWYVFVKKNYHFLFPTLCSRTCFHQRHTALLKVIEVLREKSLCLFGIESDSFGIVDRFVSLLERLFIVHSYSMKLLMNTALPRSNSKTP